MHQLEEHDSDKWQQRSQAAFEKFDLDKDGYITPEELRMVGLSQSPLTVLVGLSPSSLTIFKINSLPMIKSGFPAMYLLNFCILYQSLCYFEVRSV